jgi:hypothetical protein
MRTTPSRLIGILWGVTMLWTIAWGLFRGAYAHGGYIWWTGVHHAGTAVCTLLAIGIHWREANRRSWRMGRLASLGLAVAAVVLTVVAFQSGLAFHQRPDSVQAFLLDEP